MTLRPPALRPERCRAMESCGVGVRLENRRDGPLCLDIHEQDRRQGPGLGACLLPRRARARRLQPGRLRAASTATPRSTLRRSMQAARALRRRSTGFSTACRIIRTSATSCLSRSMVTSTSSSSIRTDASCFLKRFARHAGLSTHVTFVGLGEKFQMWEPARFEERRAQARAKVQEHRQLVRRGAPPRPGGYGRRGRSTGMMATRGSPDGRGCRGGTARHVPVLLPQVLAGARARARAQPIIDGTFGAGGYSAAILEAGARRARARASIAIPTAIAAGRAARRSYPGRLTLVEGRFGELDRVAARTPASRRPTASCSTSASPRCSSTSPGAASPSRRDGPLDMRMSTAARARAPPMSSTTRARKRTSPTSSSTWARSARSRAIARAIVAGARASRCRAHVRAGEPRRARARPPARPGRIPRRARSRRCASTSTTSSASWRAALQAAERVLEPGGRLARRHLPLARGPARQAVPRCARRAARPRARAICRRRTTNHQPRVSDSLTIGR